MFGFFDGRATNVILQITGDDTPAIQAVLDADVWRKHLLGEQDVSLSISTTGSAWSNLCRRKSQNN